MLLCFMQFIDLTFPDPESNIAFDEALLESAESGATGECLRIWESAVYFAVLGYSSRWKNELKSNLNIPFLRRKSGGQTVLQGPGCLNFSLVLKVNPATGIRTDTQNAMLKNKQAIESCLDSSVIDIRGVSDLIWRDKKFSGNAMRRGKTHYLFHGTFLYHFDLEQIEEKLGKPDREPDYRAHRSHKDFLTNIPVQKKEIIKSLKAIWQAEEELKKPPMHLVPDLARQFYSNTEWNQKF